MAPAKRAEKEKKNLENCILRRSSCGYNGKSINTHVQIQIYVCIYIGKNAERMKKGYRVAQSGADLGPQ